MCRASINRAYGTLVLSFIGCLFLTVAADATPIGNVSIANCSGGGVTVTATTIIWTPATLGGTAGCINSGIGTNITSAAGNLSSGATGNILNLTGGLPVANFVTFASTPGLHFDLTGLGPGSGNLACGALLVGQSCSAAAGSPFILTLAAGGNSSVSLAANGIAGDGVTPNSTWSGTFTTQVNMTPAQIQLAIGGGGSISSTYSTTLNLVAGSTTPEPGSSVLLSLGFLTIGLGSLRRKFRRQN